MKNQKLEQIVQCAESEYRKFKYEMMEKATGEELWNGAGKIYFYTLVKDYMEGVTEMPGAYVKVLAKEKNPLSALYEVYSDSESLGFATWEEIEEILEVMVQEEAGFAA